MKHHYDPSLIGPHATVGTSVLVIVGIIFGLGVFWGNPRTAIWRPLVLAITVSACGAALLGWAVPAYFGAIGGDKSWVFWVICGTTLFSLWVAGWVLVRQRARAYLAACSVFLSTAGLVAGLNITFSLFPTLGTLVEGAPYTTVSFEQFQQLDQHSTSKVSTPSIYGHAVLVKVPIESTVSGFTPGTSPMVYLPPAYFTDSSRQFPVIVLMAGLPGTSMDWFDYGELGQIMRDFERDHHGNSPIIVAVDATKDSTTDLGCFDSTMAKVQTYLDTDIPEGIKKYFRVSSDPNMWAIGGFSYGGTCALQVVSVNPEPYHRFFDFSGDLIPGKGSIDENAKTYFDGDQARALATDPQTVLASRKYTDISGRFVAGREETEHLTALTTLNEAAMSAGMDTQLLVVDGGHAYQTWRLALIEILPWLYSELGME